MLREKRIEVSGKRHIVADDDSVSKPRAIRNGISGKAKKAA